MVWPREVSPQPNSVVLPSRLTSITDLLVNCLHSKRWLSLAKGKRIRTMIRGAFIVLEGLDRAGKSTQVTLLMQALKERSIPAEKRVFPDRSTAIGGMINNYLAKKIELAPEAVHLLFSANRWESKDGIREKLESGTTLVVDRYAASGAAYSTATTGRTLDWCKSPDRGLPAPDLVLYLEVSSETQQSRANWGEERFERAETQFKVAANFRELSEPDSWVFLEAGRGIDEVHASILEKALAAVEACKSKPIKLLYES